MIVQHPQRALRDNGIVATPSTPRETAFENLRNSDVTADWVQGRELTGGRLRFYIHLRGV